MFVVDGQLLVNEIAPRPHNSGHYTIDACRTSQFEQQVRVLCGLPLGDASLHTPAVMVNLLAISGARRTALDAVPAPCRRPPAPLRQTRGAPGAQDGHVTVCEPSLDLALGVAMEIRRELGIAESA